MMKATGQQGLLVGTVAAALLAAGLAAAQSIPGYPEHVSEYDPREVVMLPEYCKYTQLFRERVPGGNDREMIERWQSMLGDVFMHMHHYCWGLMHLHRAKVLARDAQARAFNFDRAVVEFDYVIDRSPRDFVLLPEILTKKGEALLGLGKAARALSELERAIVLKPDYWPPYAHLSDHYRANGQTAKARQILETGLERSNGAKALQRRLQELHNESAKVGDKRPPQ